MHHMVIHEHTIQPGQTCHTCVGIYDDFSIAEKTLLFMARTQPAEDSVWIMSFETKDDAIDWFTGKDHANDNWCKQH